MMTTGLHKHSDSGKGHLRKRAPSSSTLPEPKRKRSNEHVDETLSKILEMIESLPSKHKTLIQGKLGSLNDTHNHRNNTSKRTNKSKSSKNDEKKYSAVSSNQQRLLLSRVNSSTLVKRKKPVNHLNAISKPDPVVVIDGIEYFDVDKNTSSSSSIGDNSDSDDSDSGSSGAGYSISDDHPTKNSSTRKQNTGKSFKKIDISAFLSDDSYDDDDDDRNSESDSDDDDGDDNGSKNDSSSVDTMTENHIPKILAPHLYAYELSKAKSVRKDRITRESVTESSDEQSDVTGDYGSDSNSISDVDVSGNYTSIEDSEYPIKPDYVDDIILSQSGNSGDTQFSDLPEPITFDGGSTSNDGNTDKVFKDSDSYVSDNYIKVDSESDKSCETIPADKNTGHLSPSGNDNSDESEISSPKITNNSDSDSDSSDSDIEMFDKEDKKLSRKHPDTSSSIDLGSNSSSSDDSSRSPDQKMVNMCDISESLDSNDSSISSSSCVIDSVSICTSSSESIDFQPTGGRENQPSKKLLPLSDLPSLRHQGSKPTETKMKLSELTKCLARTCYLYLPIVTTELLPAQAETLEFIKKHYHLAMEDIEKISSKSNTKNPLVSGSNETPTSNSEILPEHARGVIVANTMGVGKTLTSIAFCVWLIREYVTNRKQTENISQSLVNFPRFLIVCTKTLLDEWKAEFVKHTENIACYIYDNISCRKHDLKPYSIILSTYSRFSAEVKHVNTIGKNGKYGTSTLLEKSLFKSVILDECHMIKGRTTGFCTSLQSLECPSYRIVLSGSPFQNNMEELYPLFQFIKIPKLISYQGFKELPIDDKLDFITNITDKYMVRKRLDVVSKCRIFEITVNLGPAASLVYESVLNNCIVNLRKGTLTPSEMKNNKLKTLSKLRMICSNGGLLSNKYLSPQNSLDDSTNISTTSPNNKKTSKVITHIDTNKKPKVPKFDINIIYDTPFTDEPTEKMKKSLEIILWEIDRDQTVKIIIVSNFLSTIHSVAHYLNHLSKTRITNTSGSKVNLGKAVVIEGNITREQRTSILAKFQNPTSGIRFLCASAKTIAVGLNIQMASIMVFFDQTPNPKDFDQTVARIDRYGQKKKVRVYNFRSSYDSAFNLDATDRSTVEHHIGKRHESKNVIFDGLIDRKGDREAIKTACSNMNSKIGRTSDLEIMNKHILDFENISNTTQPPPPPPPSSSSSSSLLLSSNSSSNTDNDGFLRSFSSLNQKIMNGTSSGRNNTTASAHEACIAVDQWEEWKRSVQISKSIKNRCSSKPQGCNFTTISEHEYSQVLCLHPGVILYGLDISKHPLLYLSKLHDNLLFLSVQSLTKYLHAIMLNLIFQDKDTCFKQASSVGTAHQDCARFIDYEEYLAATSRYRQAYKDVIRSQTISKNNPFSVNNITSTGNNNIHTFSGINNPHGGTNNTNQFSTSISDTVYVKPTRHSSNTTNTAPTVTDSLTSKYVSKINQQLEAPLTGKLSGNLFDSDWDLDIIMYKVESKILPEENNIAGHSFIDSFSGRVTWNIEENFAFAPTARSWKGRHTNRPISESPTRVIPRSSVTKFSRICLSHEPINVISKSSLASAYNSSGLSSDNLPLRCSMIQKIIEVSLALKLSQQPHQPQLEQSTKVTKVEPVKHLTEESTNQVAVGDPDVMIISPENVKKSPYEQMIEKQEQENMKLPLIQFNSFTAVTCLLETYCEHYPSVLKSERVNHTCDENSINTDASSSSSSNINKNGPRKPLLLLLPDEGHLLENSTSETFTKSIAESDPKSYYKNPHHHNHHHQQQQQQQQQQQISVKSNWVGKFCSLESNPIDMMIKDSINHHLVVIGNLQTHSTSTSLFSMMMMSSKQESKSLCDTSDLFGCSRPSLSSTSKFPRQLPSYYSDNFPNTTLSFRAPFVSNTLPSKAPQLSEILLGKDISKPVNSKEDTGSISFDGKKPLYESTYSTFPKSSFVSSPPVSITHDKIIDIADKLISNDIGTTLKKGSTSTSGNSPIHSADIDYSQLHQNCSYSVYDNSNKQFGVYINPESSVELLLSPSVYCKTSFIVYSIKASQCPFLTIQLNIYHIHKYTDHTNLVNITPVNNRPSINRTPKKTPKNDTEYVLASLLVDYFKIHFIRLFTRLEEKTISSSTNTLNSATGVHSSFLSPEYCNKQKQSASSLTTLCQDQHDNNHKELSINIGQTKGETECYIYVESTEYCNIIKSLLCENISTYVETAIKSLHLHHLVGDLLSDKCKTPQEFCVEIKDMRLRKSLERIACVWNPITLLPHLFSVNS